MDSHTYLLSVDHHFPNILTDTDIEFHSTSNSHCDENGNRHPHSHSQSNCLSYRSPHSHSHSVAHSQRSAYANADLDVIEVHISIGESNDLSLHKSHDHSAAHTKP